MISRLFPKVKTWFDQYVAGFYTDNSVDNQVFHLKQDHTYRVCRNAALLSDTLKLSPEDTLLAQTASLLHDVGRFKQFALYRTFKDSASENHALLGLRIIGLHQVLSGLLKEERRLICRAIAYHNAANLPANENERSLFFMKLLRDADKLDIYRVVIDNYRDQGKVSKATIEHGLPDTPFCSPKIIKTLMEKKTASFEDMKFLNDFKLLQIAWVYDLNFTSSFREIHRHKYIEQIADFLPPTEPVQTAVRQALEHIRSHM